MSTSLNIAFDVVGTLVGYENFYGAIEQRLGERLRTHSVKSDMFGYMWIEVAEREYTYLSVSGQYVPYAKVIEAMFWRMLWKAGIEEPRDFATDQDLESIMQGYRNMDMRPGAAECIQKLRDAGFTVWGFTMDDLERVRNMFTRSGIELPQDNLRGCDSSAIGKPDPKAYTPLLEELSSGGKKPWFAAAHMWDVSAARRAGYRGAYCTVWEREPLTHIFGDMDVIADSLPETADLIIKASQ